MNPTELLELSAAPKAYLAPEEAAAPRGKRRRARRARDGSTCQPDCCLDDRTAQVTTPVPGRPARFSTRNAPTRLFPHAPKLTRCPDVSFVRRERLPTNEVPDGNMLILPDAVVEVVSPNDGAERRGNASDGFCAGGGATHLGDLSENALRPRPAEERHCVADSSRLMN